MWAAPARRSGDVEVCHYPQYYATANFNNCSGKHTAMLAHAKMRGLRWKHISNVVIRFSRIF